MIYKKASLEETNMRRQLEDIKVILEEEIKDRKMKERELGKLKKQLDVIEPKEWRYNSRYSFFCSWDYKLGK